MYLSPTDRTRQDVSESSIVSTADSSQPDPEFDTVTVSSGDSSSSIIDSSDSDSSIEQTVPSLLTREDGGGSSQCSNWYALGSMRGVAE